MSLESEDRNLQDPPTEMKLASEKKSKITYTTEFLFSLSELDICKKLPSGFDPAIISEFREASQERQRTSGSFSSSSFRTIEYGSSPPTRGDLNSHSRGTHGRWESRSVGKNDKDGDSQPDLDADSGKHYTNPSRRTSQAPEHDGLLGSGSFPRPSGYASGLSAPKFRSNDHYQLSRSSEPYQPPRPYKAVPHTRRDTHDSFNDETFGSSESASEDKVEEERKRRAAFEMMRKEQQKVFHERKKLNLDKHSNAFDMSLLLKDSKNEKKPLKTNNGSDETIALQAPYDDSEKFSLPSQAPMSRPLVPPGFKTVTLDQNSGTKSSISSQQSEVGNSELEENYISTKDKNLLKGTSDSAKEQLTEQMGLSKQQYGTASILNLSSALNLSYKTTEIDIQSSKSSEVSEASESRMISDLNSKKVLGDTIIDEPDESCSTSILDKVFGGALTSGGGSGSVSANIVHQEKVDETWSPRDVQSSKFAQWFVEEERGPINDLASSRPNDLLSMLVGGEKGTSEVDSKKTEEHSLHAFSLQGTEPQDKHIKSAVAPAQMLNSEKSYNKNKSKTVSTVLTCEDLEQSILSEISETGSALTLPIQEWCLPVAETKQQPKVDIDNHASQHLLSLLTKAMDQRATEPSTSRGVDEDGSISTSLFSSRDDKKRENVPSNPGHSPTLEALFGTAFMKELQSVGAPVSAKRGATTGVALVDVSESPALHFPVWEDGLLSSTNGIGSRISSQNKSDMTQKQWLKFEDPEPKAVSSPHFRTESGSKIGGYDGPATEFPLPLEDSLVTSTDPMNIQNLFSTGNSRVDIAEKLASLNPAFKREQRPMIGGQEVGSFHHAPYDMREPEIPFQNLNFQPSRINHMGHFPQSESQSRPININPRMKFMMQENLIHHDPSPPNHQFPGNIVRPPFHHPGLTGFDPSSHSSSLQQAHMAGNFPRPHPLQGGGLSRGAPLVQHPSRSRAFLPQRNNQVPGFMSELNPIQNFPSGGGVNHPETIQRLIEMDMRAKSKQFHPFPGSGRSQGLYEHELDMGFGHR